LHIFRDDLKDYWQKVIAIDKVMDFAKHHCSADIKSFLQVDENTKNKVMRDAVFSFSIGS